MRQFSTILALSGILLATFFVSLQNAVAQTEPDPTPLPPRTHVISDGESLDYIARFYAITTDALQQANNITDPSLIFIGQELIIPYPEEIKPPRTHTVAEGESFIYLAELYGISIEALAQTNNITDTAQIAVGQELIIPDPVETVTIAPERPPFHTIGSGESLAYIAGLYDITVEALQLVNNITDPALIFVGQELAIPSATGDEVPTSYRVEYGDTLANIALRYSTTVTAVAQANQIVAPQSLYAGQNLIFLSKTGTGDPLPIEGQAYLVQAGDTLWQIAAQYNLVVQELADLNQLDIDDQIYEGERLRLPLTDEPFTDLPSGWLEISLSPTVLYPGDTAVLSLIHREPGAGATIILTDPEGTVTEINTTAASSTTHKALIGFDAFALPGRHWVEIQGEGLSRPWRPFRQQITVGAASYGLQQITLTGNFATLLTPELRFRENAFLAEIFKDSANEPQWEGQFIQPVTDTVVTARYGDFRSYNGAPVINFHSGIDFSGGIGTPIVAPAVGTVVFSDTLELRGNGLIIDHGMGVMTAYYHLSEIEVEVGEVVAQGQPIAKGGSTGLSTGPHLHWDLRIWGAAVEPTQWLENSFP